MLMQTQETQALSARRLPAISKMRRSLDQMIQWRQVQVIGLWIERRRQRLALARLDDRLLRDIGIERADANREIAKPFWRK